MSFAFFDTPAHYSIGCVEAAVGSSSFDPSLVPQDLSQQEQDELHTKLHSLEEESLDRVVAWLGPDIVNPDDEEISVHLNTMTVERKRELVKIVNAEIEASTDLGKLSRMAVRLSNRFTMCLIRTPTLTNCHSVATKQE